MAKASSIRLFGSLRVMSQAGWTQRWISEGIGSFVENAAVLKNKAEVRLKERALSTIDFESAEADMGYNDEKKELQKVLKKGEYHLCYIT